MTKPIYDTALRPQDDYFGYINNPWLAANPIPASESNWGTFYMLRDQAWKAVSDIVEELRSSSSDDADSQLLKQFFDAALTYENHTDNHLLTLKTELQKIDAITTPSELAHYLGYAHSIDLNMLWSAFVGMDDKDSTNQILATYQQGLGMPNRDYYLDDDERMKKFRIAYQTFHTQLNAHLSTTSDWEQVFGIEKQLAEASWTDVQLRDVEKNYNRYTLAMLAEQFPTFDWSEYWNGLGWKTPSDNIVISQPTFIARCIELLDEDVDKIKQYLRWRLTSALAGWISPETNLISFEFYGKTLGGQTEQKPLWKRAVLLSDGLIIGEALGKTYAARYFPESSKQAVLTMVEDIRRVYHKRIDDLTWMSEPTKLRAHKKLDNIKVFIGYPTVWRDVSAISFSSDNVLSNIFEARLVDTAYHLAKIGTKPADEEWEMFAHTVNAYHHPNRLEIVFPAAILQAPFFDPTASYATNLGGIGAVIGHEFTHGFDDQGAQFDEMGNVKSWQSDDERAEFTKRAQIIVEQANKFETIPGTYLQGNLVLGEAIADVGGLQLAVEALKAAEPDSAPTALFENFARVECGQATEDLSVQLAKTDPHPPSRFRVNCVVNHLDEF